jgi:Tol biopolymer transport system component
MAAGSNRLSRGTWMPPILLLAAALLCTSPAAAVTAHTTRASVSSAEAEGTGDSFSHPDISATGRYAVFESDATNLVANDLAGHEDVFVRDRVGGTTRRVSLNSRGKPGNNNSMYPSISASGRYVAFLSDATNLVKGDTNGVTDVFRRDRKTGKTVRISVSSRSKQANGLSSYTPSISADGSRIAFYSEATNLVAHDSNGVGDVFVRDLRTKKTVRASVKTNGGQANRASSEPDISANGAFVAFTSEATKLVSGDGNGAIDIFVRKLDSSPKTTRVSVSSSETEGGGPSDRAALSSSGRFVVFESSAEDFVGFDSNAQDDVFIRDRKRGTTKMVSIAGPDSGPTQGNGLSRAADISGDGRYVAWMSDSTTFVGNDTDPSRDIYVRDRKLNRTILASVSTTHTGGNDSSIFPAISTDGRFVIFSSPATDLVANDTNGANDDFLRGPLH